MLEYLLLLENTFRKCVERVTAMFVFCRVFVGICLFLLQKLLQVRQLASVVSLVPRVQYIALTDNKKLQRVLNCLARTVTRSPCVTRSMLVQSLCSGFLYDIVS